MKYNQFLELSEILESRGISIDDFKLLEVDQVAAATGKQKTQAAAPAQPAQPAQPAAPATLAQPAAPAQTLDTEKGGVFTRWGRMKKKLNKVGTDTQNQITEKVLKKYLPTILKSEQTIAEKIKAGKETDPEKLKQVVNNNYKAIKVQQDKQVALIENAITKFLENVTGKMNAKIDASKMTDDNKTRLKNYWILLTTQISMNATTYMITEREKILDSIFGNDKKAAEEAKAAILKEQRSQRGKKAAETKKQKAAAAAEEAKLKAAETPVDASTGQPAAPAAPAAQPAAPAAQPAAPAAQPAAPAAPAQ